MKKQKKNGHQPLKPKPIQRLLVVIAAVAISIGAMLGIFKAIGFETPVDKLIVIVSWIGIVVYISYDIKDKIEKWRL